MDHRRDSRLDDGTNVPATGPGLVTPVASHLAGHRTAWEARGVRPQPAPNVMWAIAPTPVTLWAKGITASLT